MIPTTTAILRRPQIVTQFTGGIAIAFLAIAAIFVAPTAVHGDLTGALFSTDSACTGVDLNIYQNKGDVYIDGGPAHKGFGTGLPDGSYCVQVTEPGANGAVLGTSAPGAVVVSGGEFVQNGQQGPCYQLSAILTKTSDGTPGYDTTSNPGNEYTVWISPVTDGGTCSFDPNRSKTDNFKVTGGETPPPSATICVHKFYDANLDGQPDNNELEITGWPYTLSSNNNFSDTNTTPHCSKVELTDPDKGTFYTADEGNPVAGSGWVHTTAAEFSPIYVNNDGDTVDVYFGNVCYGTFNGGLTLGYWANHATGKGATVTGLDLTFLSGLNLVNATGGHQTFATGSDLNKWLLGATATNMAYMLSAQLAAMELNVRHLALSKITGNELVYAPDITCAGVTTQSGFISIKDLMTAANNLLVSPGNLTKVASPLRTCEEVAKNALDAANNGNGFLHSTPCDLPNFN